MARFDPPTDRWRDFDHDWSGEERGALERTKGTGDDDRIVGTHKADTIDGRGGDDMILGRRGADVLDGGHGDDLLGGGFGSDSLFGGSGHDLLRGGTIGQERGSGGSDRLDGGSGADRLMGGFDADILIGGAGRDHFIFDHVTDSAIGRSDLVEDFEQGLDNLVFRGQFRGSDVLRFIGDAPFSHSSGEVRFETLPDTQQTEVFVDLDGDGEAEFGIVFTHMIQFQAGDFSF